MTTNSKTPKVADAPASEKRPTSPGLGDEAMRIDEPVERDETFDPNKFQAHRMPPGLLAELVALELPSMPKERLQETLPPVTAAQARASGRPIDPVKAQATTVVEIPSRISFLPKAPSIAAKPVSPQVVPPKPAQKPVESAKPNTSVPPPVQMTKPRSGTKSVVVRIVLPVALLSFVAGGLVFGSISRNDVKDTNAARATSVHAVPDITGATENPTVPSALGSTAKPVPTLTGTRSPSLSNRERTTRPVKASPERANPSVPKPPKGTTGELSFDTID